MQRRDFMRWAIHGMGAVFGAVLGVPALAYLVDARNRPGRESDFRTVASLNELVEGIPTEVIVKETRIDAWTLHPDDIVGRVWLIRRANDKVEAFTTICPHLGCSVNLVGTHFLCPCHGGFFTLEGRRITVDPINGLEIRNPAPRDMDRLEEKIVADPQNPEAKLVQVKYVRFKTNQSEKEVDS